MELKEIETPLAKIKKDAVLSIANFNVSFNKTETLKDITVDFYKNRINCIIGPSGSGKSTLLKSINRINDDAHKIVVNGEINYHGRNILLASEDITLLRKKIGMVFQSPCVFPKSILENVLFGVQYHQKLSKSEKLQIAEENLKAVSLWDEVSERLQEPANTLSIGQQQRLCIARALAIKPEILLMDEPTSSLDPISSRAIEQLMITLKEKYTIVFVTHNIAQAKRIADQLIFICEGMLIEAGSKEKLFSNPSIIQTKTYLQDEYCEC